MSYAFSQDQLFLSFLTAAHTPDMAGYAWWARRQSSWIHYALYRNLGFSLFVHYFGYDPITPTHYVDDLDQATPNVWPFLLFLCITPFSNLDLARSKFWSTGDGQGCHWPFITMGFISFVFLIPLALTSNQWSVRLLGKNWNLLHRLIYIIACTAITHYWWHKAGKNDLGTVTIYALILLLLLTFRIPKIKQYFK